MADIWDLIQKEFARPISKSINSIPTNCPNCGAVIDIHADKCAYCDTPYAFARANNDINTVKLYADNIVISEMQTDVNRKLIESMKIQRGLF